MPASDTRQGSTPRTAAGNASSHTSGTAGNQAGDTGNLPWNQQHDRFSTLGLTMLFTVVVDGLGFPHDLGGWTACDGLKVDFQYDRIRSGGEYEYTHMIPTNISYPPVTLRRGMDRTSSKKVEALLTKVVSQWADGKHYGSNPDSGSDLTVTIALFDVHKNQPVTTWTMPHAHITSWTGPSLSATANGVAIESLVFEHQGFLRSAT